MRGQILQGHPPYTPEQIKQLYGENSGIEHFTTADKSKLDGLDGSGGGGGGGGSYTHPNHTGDVTSAGDGATTISANAVTTAKVADDAITNAKLANMATATLKGRNSAGTGDPEDLSATQAKALLGLGNVDNTADEDKPISTATQNALDDKQATLVSGTNIKTINNQTLLGTGNITISGGGGGSATDLSYTASPTGGTVASSTGEDATLTLANGTNAGLMAPAQHSKLAGIEANATADMSGAEIKSAYESESNTNAFTDSEKSKLAAIEANATANDSNSALRDRSTHTGTQAILTVTGLQTALDDKLESSDIADFETTSQLNTRDTDNRDRDNHTGTQTASTISDFDTAVDARITASNKISSDITGLTGATQVTNHVIISQAGYDAIGTPDANTVYEIVG